MCEYCENPTVYDHDPDAPAYTSSEMSDYIVEEFEPLKGSSPNFPVRLAHIVYAPQRPELLGRVSDYGWCIATFNEYGCYDWSPNIFCCPICGRSLE